jgi:undecaprenyl diphosphate synthase
MKQAVVPEHVAIIMDGNGRWATLRKRPRFVGHKAGVNALRRTVKACKDQGVHVLTVFAFGMDNWKRPKAEVSLLLNLFIVVLKREIKKLHQEGVRIKFIGDMTAFSDKLLSVIKEAEALTAHNEALIFNIAANYSGQWDIIQATQKLTQQVVSGEIQSDAINADLFEQQLMTAGLPLPDLLIRTSGVSRISNFMLWQLVYTELYFCDVYWPDFDENELLKAIDFFNGCDRRFGHTNEQLRG